MKARKKIALQTNYVRDYNIKLIMSLLYKEHLSCQELSKKISISNNGVKKIILELEELKAVRLVDTRNEVKTKGNQHIRYEINGELGIFLIIDFTKTKESFAIYDFAGRKLYSESFYPPLVYTDESEFDDLILTIKQRIKELGLESKKILNVTISVVGQVDEENRCFTISSRFKLFENDNEGRMYSIFENAFNAPVIMKNNVAFMAIGESEAGFFSEHNMALFIFAGWGIASTVLYNNKPLVGWRGYAGEIGGNKIGEDTTLSLQASIKHNIKKCAQYLETPDFEGLLKAYETNDCVKEIVLNGAKVLATSIAHFCNLLGVDIVMLCGECTEFGEEYLETIQEIVLKQTITRAKVVCSRLKNLVEKGALSIAKKREIEEIIKMRNRNIEENVSN